MELEQPLFPMESFTLTYGRTTLFIEPMSLPDRWGCRVTFSSNRKVLVIVRATDKNGDSFWTSIPEGRQGEAEGVGKLIQDYLQKKEA